VNVTGGGAALLCAGAFADAAVRAQKQAIKEVDLNERGKGTFQGDMLRF
jgi:hypothetical protein